MLVSDADLAALKIPVAYHARVFAAIEQFKRVFASGSTESLPSFFSSFMSHSASASAPAPAPAPPFARRRPCKFFVESHCRYGADCTFLHDKGARKKFQASLAKK